MSGPITPGSVIPTRLRSLLLLATQSDGGNNLCMAEKEGESRNRRYARVGSLYDGKDFLWESCQTAELITTRLDIRERHLEALYITFLTRQNFPPPQETVEGGWACELRSLESLKKIITTLSQLRSMKPDAPTIRIFLKADGSSGLEPCGVYRLPEGFSTCGTKLGELFEAT